MGGKNPALRTFFYRLVKLLALPIYPVFVFDGKGKPRTKRGKTVSRWNGSCLPIETSKKLISLFKFPCHVAPGEAEAECAMLQKRGIVDAVMTQDVDAIMFGSGLTLRDWSKEHSKHNKTPTHVNVFDLEKLKEISHGLDSEGMILVALLSGGDYDEDGLAGIGCTLACEIARAGFGSDLLDLVRKGDEEGIKEWRERLQYELESNESGYFKIKRKSVKILDTFPDREILAFYVNPAVTEDGDELLRLERKWKKVWDEEIDVPALRHYVGDTFEWLYKPGAWKFVRCMAPALLADRLRRGTATSLVTSVEQITEQRKHFVSDGIPELRVTVTPADVVGVDLDAEEDSPEYLERLAAQEKEEDEGADIGDEGDVVPASPSKKRKTPPWLPWNPERMWIAETIVELGAREHVETWRQTQWEIENDPKKFATRKCGKQKEPKKAKAKGGMQSGALMGYLAPAKATSKPDASIEMSSDTAAGPVPKGAAPVDMISLPSPPRTKANMKTRRAPRTPTKPKSIQPEQGSSTGMLDFFKSTKSSQLQRSSQETVPSYENPLTKLVDAGLQGEEDPCSTNSLQGEKHSRPSTSSSSEVVRRTAKRSVKPRPDEARDVVKAALVLPDPKHGVRLQLKTLPVPTQKASTMSELVAREVIVIPSSPIVETTSSEDPLKNVTQRTPQRGAKKDRAHPEIQPADGSPKRAKRPIESFFRPYLKSRPKEVPPPQEVVSEEKTASIAIPPEMTTGLQRSLAHATNIRVIPRSSLPGTWKEVECQSGPNSQIQSSGTSRAPRVSIVDLTAD